MWKSTQMTSPLLAAFAVLALASAAGARTPAITVTDAWSRPTPPGAPTAAGYLTITNTGAKPDRLVSAETPAAAGLTLHLMTDTGGIMRMRAVPEGVMVPPRAGVSLDPNGYHLMFEGLKAPFKAGDQIPAVLHFQHAGPIKVRFSVGAAPRATTGMDMH